ncbi:DMT transporter permease [Actinoplanes sp. NBRC 14428]|uniref:Inner membrane transporter RhtA n=1 Tax=Pseudosporangium ferrugineum TaxID=439699 RepID=A0A2T0SCV5_9ACTN|nr:EamA family transporter [Pseudosporangium ferrugineum]PRY31255.1 inner membrane transporter RhtA [Pseudosporangium ferrugineum]BCJ54609.1 DMT transporter permease [Actinoplanes sp. NBRC 14428]
MTIATPRIGAAPGPAVLMVLGSCASLQVGAALAARLFPVTGSAGATLLRLSLAAGVLLAVARPAVRSWRRHQWRAVLLLGATMAGMNGFFYAAIARVPLGPAVTIQFLGPLTLAAILSRRLRDFGWVLLAAAGVAAFGFGDGATALDPLGVVFVVLAGVFWALYIVASSHAGAAVAGQGGLAVAMTVGALVLLPGGMTGAEKALTSPHLLLIALGTGLLASVIPYTLELSALRRLPKRAFGVLLSLEPAAAALAGWLLLAQPLTPIAAAAVVLVVVASIGSTAFS